ncbi:MAG TPA: kelch repeat-containing protein [Kofleriaceae bacterium]
MRPCLACLTLALAACGDSAAQVTLVPAFSSDCAQPAGAVALELFAYAPSGQVDRTLPLDGSLALDDLPRDTVQLGVVVAGTGGTIAAQGKSALLDYTDLEDGAQITVAMAPPNGFCHVGPLTEPRAQPLVAAAGNGALVIGGTGPAGPLSTAEYYDATTGTFTSVAVPEDLGDPEEGFRGAALASLPDGRAALIGGANAAVTIFDPAAVGGPAFGAPGFVEPRAFHAALALDATDVLVAGGCSAVAVGACAGDPRRQIRTYDLAELHPTDGPELPAIDGQRIDATLFDLGTQLDGTRRFTLAGGTGDPGLADRFALGDGTLANLAGTFVQAAALDGGAVLTAFAADASAPDGTASVLGPDGTAGPAASAPARAGVRLVALEDGRVLGVGGDPSALLYNPALDAWDELDPCTPGDGCESTGTLAGPSLARLADGSVLVVGGAQTTDAWIFRPSLVGPEVGSVTATPLRDSSIGTLTAPDPSSVTRGDEWLLSVPAGAAAGTLARALVGGPRIASGTVSAVVHVSAGGAALIAAQDGPGEAVEALVASGAPVTLVHVSGGTSQTLCTGDVTTFDASSSTTLTLVLSGHDAQLTRDGAVLLSCSASVTGAGSWGVAALGPGAQVAVDSVTVSRP